MSVCIPKEIAQSLKAAVESGEVSLMKLSKMSTEERSAVFQKYLKDPEVVKKLNIGFEARMNSETAGILRKYIIREMDKVPPRSKKDLLNKLNKIENVLNPKEGKPFLADLAEQKVGVKLSQEEAGNIFKYVDEAKKVKDKIIAEKIPLDSPIREEYALKQLDLDKYTNALLQRSYESVSDMFNAARNADDLSDKTAKYSKALFFTGTSGLGSILKAALASIDNSVWGVQGIKTLLRGDVKFWAKNAYDSTMNIPKAISGAGGSVDESVIGMKRWINIERKSPLVDRELVELYKSDNYINGVYERDGGFYGLDILGRGEEAIPPSVLSRLKGLGRLQAGTEDLYNSSVIRLRRRIADQLIENAKNLDIDVFDKEVAQTLGEAASSLTGRGRLHWAESSGNFLNLTFFSARLLKSTLDTYWLPFRGVTFGANNAAERLVAKESAKVWRGIAGIVGATYTSQQILGEDVVKIDTHPTSSTFGQVSIAGGRPIEIFGGNLSVARVIARMFSDKIYDPKLGVFKERKFYEDNTDALVQFFTNKKSPWASFIKDVFIKQEHFNGDPVTPASIVENYLIPITWQGFREDAFEKNDLSSALLYSSASALGFSSKDMKWNPSGEEWKGLKAANEKKYWEAVSELGSEMDTMIEEWRTSDEYQEMTEEERAKYAEKTLNRARNSVISNYSDFIPEETPEE
jgi:hypothetical protein